MSSFHEYALPVYRGKSAKKRRRKRKLITVSLAVLTAVVLLLVYFQRNVTRVLVSISEATMRASTTVAVNDAVYYTLSDEMRYSDLVTITRNEAGDVVSFSANPLKINKIARDTASIS